VSTNYFAVHEKKSDRGQNASSDAIRWVYANYRYLAGVFSSDFFIRNT